MRSKLILLLLVLSFTKISNAADYYWVGGTGNWSDYSNHWATSTGGSTFHSQVPTTLDNVFFDANSFSGSGQVVTIDLTIVQCKNMSWVGVTNTPTLTMSVFSTMKIFGSMTLVAGMNTNLVSPISFESTAPGQTITTAGKVLTRAAFNGIGGEWTLQDNFKATAVLELYNGTLNSNNQPVQTEQFRIYNSGVTLNMGSSVFTITYRWDVMAPCTINAGTSTINLSPISGTPTYFYGGGRTYNNLSFTYINDYGFLNDNNTFTGNVSFLGEGWIEGNNTFNILTFSPGHTYTLRNGRTQTINGSVAATGICTSLISISSSVSGSPTTISKTSGSITVSYVTLKDITATGGASFTANNSIDLGNNSGWTFGSSASQNLYWIGNSGNWGDGNHWSLSSGGPAYGCAPAAGDNVFFDANSFTSAGQTVTINVPVALCKNMSWVGVTNTPTLTMSVFSTMKIFGSMTLVAGMNTNLVSPISFESTAPGQTITTAGKVLTRAAFNGIGGEWTLQDNFKATAVLELYNGTLNSNNQPVQTEQFRIFNPGFTLNMGSSVFTITYKWEVFSSCTINAGTSTINISSTGPTNTYFYGHGRTYNNLNFTNSNDLGFLNDNNTFTGNVSFLGEGWIEGNNTFNILTLSPGHTYTFRNGRTQTITPTGNLVALGNAGFPIRIQSSVSGSPSTFFKASGSICLDYVRISDNTATGGAVFNAGLSPTRSLDMGGNSGWLFTGSSATFYQDADGDGYGNPAFAVQVCTPPSGYVIDNTDCNDNNAAINPGVVEVCGNGIDDNCDGLIDPGCCTGAVSAGPDVSSYFGVIDEQCVNKTAVVQNGTAPFTYSWTIDRSLLPGETITNASAATVTVCLRDTANLCVIVTDANGCEFTDCANIFAQDVRCFAGNSGDHKIFVCHNNNTICVDQSMLTSHLNHGDYVGQCISNTLNRGETVANEISGSGVKIYPNPGHGSFTLYINSRNPDINYIDAEIINMSGQIIKQVKINGQSKIDFTIKNAGVYFIRVISSDKKILTRKVVVLE